MKNLIYVKKHFLAVFAIMLSLGYGSFSFAKAKFATNWHLLTQASTPANDVVGAITMNPTQGGTCNTALSPVRCSIQFDNDFNANIVGLTVSAAEALPGVDETARTYKP